MAKIFEGDFTRQFFKIDDYVDQSYQVVIHPLHIPFHPSIYPSIYNDYYYELIFLFLWYLLLLLLGCLVFRCLNMRRIGKWRQLLLHWPLLARRLSSPRRTSSLLGFNNTPIILFIGPMSLSKPNHYNPLLFLLLLLITQCIPALKFKSINLSWDIIVIIAILSNKNRRISRHYYK